MDTVSMLNTMRFYCQPILPLVYDESMSYYETLCKVVGQLNTTGETVNKLNEGLTGEISDRQAADAALDARIKEIEETNRKIHFLKVDTLGHLLTQDVTRETLSKWIIDGDIISLLYAPDELENSWAVAANYRSQGATSPDSMQLKFFVPISITNNAGKSGLDIQQEIVQISLPVGALTNQWVVRSITSTIPNTNADGFVNLMATVSDAGAVTCDVEPGEIVDALRNYFSGTNQYAVAVNARLTYDSKQYHSASAVVKAEASGTGNIRIAFDNYWDGVRTENGVRQTTNETIFLVGDVKTNTWSVETIDHKTFDFSRYEGFQFTRGAHNVITTDDESTPNAVYAQYHSDTSGKIYQNLPTRLIDTVDGAEYWNGTFDIYGGNHMSFTFVTSNYATSSDKMLVRVIELSADVGTTSWKYGVKEFTLPLDASDKVVVYTASKVGEGEYSAAKHKIEYQVDFAEGVPAIITSIEAGNRVILRVDLKEPGSESGGTPLYFASGYTRVDVFTNAISYVFSGSISNGHFTLELNSALEHATLTDYGEVLPVPNPDGSDNGKVPTVNGTEWGLKDSSKQPLYITIDVVNIDDRIYKLTDGSKTYTVEEIYSAKENGAPVFIAPADIGSYFNILDFSFSNTAFKAFFINVIRRTDMSYGKLTMSTVNGQTKGTYVLSGFLAAPGSTSNGKFLKMKQDGSGIDYVDATSAEFVISATPNVDSTATLNKTLAQIIEAINGGKTPVVTMPFGDAETVRLPLLSINDGNYMVFSNAGMQQSNSIVAEVTVMSTGDANYRFAYLLNVGEDGTLPQISMASAPTSDMQIATKKYVDDAVAGAGGSDGAVLYTAQTLTSPQQAQARKNIGALGSVSPNIKSFMIITPQNEADGIGVALSARGTGGNFTLDIADANEGNPTKLMGVKTPTDAETNAAANVEYVKNKLAGATGGTVDEAMSDTSTNAVQNKVITKYVDDSVGKKLNQTEPIIKDGLTIQNTSDIAIRMQPDSLTSATGEDFASLDFSDSSPQAAGNGIVIDGLANFGDAEAVGLENTAVSYAQLVGYTKPLTLTYANSQVTGASYTDIRKAIERGRQIKLAVANTVDIIATNAKNETDKSVLKFIETDVGGDTVFFKQYYVTAQTSGITVNTKSMELP